MTANHILLAELRIAEIDDRFPKATGWGSWMVEAANEREGLVNALRKEGHQNGESQRAAAVADYRQWIMQPEQAHLRDAARTELRGKDLACWCPPDQPCHADVLLALANG
jgi:hypothetical protein